MEHRIYWSVGQRLPPMKGALVLVLANTTGALRVGMKTMSKQQHASSQKKQVYARLSLVLHGTDSEGAATQEQAYVYVDGLQRSEMGHMRGDENKTKINTKHTYIPDSWVYTPPE